MLHQQRGSRSLCRASTNVACKVGSHVPGSRPIADVPLHSWRVEVVVHGCKGMGKASRLIQFMVTAKETWMLHCEKQE